MIREPPFTFTPNGELVPKDLDDEIERLRAECQRYLGRWLAAERERCAKLVEDKCIYLVGRLQAKAIAYEIRKLTSDTDPTLIAHDPNLIGQRASLPLAPGQHDQADDDDGDHEAPGHSD